MSKYRLIEEVKQKISAFLLQNAEDLLVTSGCPIRKVRKHEINLSISIVVMLGYVII